MYSQGGRPCAIHNRGRLVCLGTCHRTLGDCLVRIIIYESWVSIALNVIHHPVCGQLVALESIGILGNKFSIGEQAKGVYPAKYYGVGTIPVDTSIHVGTAGNAEETQNVACIGACSHGVFATSNKICHVIVGGHCQ